MNYYCVHCGFKAPSLGILTGSLCSKSDKGNHEPDQFTRDDSFDARFKDIQDLKWYPYVGKHFVENRIRIMVYAHNISIEIKRYDESKLKWAEKSTWAKSMAEYTYCRKKHTNAFRYFIKGAVGLKSNYDEKDSEPSVKQRVDSFVECIAYLNFIQDLVKSDNAMAPATAEQIRVSEIVNHEIIKTLGITHCICWGKPYDYVRESFNVLSQKELGRKGFASCVIDVGEGKTMQCLRIFHPSNPFGFRPLSESTHSIISGFLEKIEN